MGCLRKNKLMYELFGRADGQCKDCKHFTSYKYHDYRYRKCLVYGDTCSEASDWTGKWQACGLFNQDTECKNVIRLVTGGRPKEDIHIDGQMDLFTDYPGMPGQFDNMTGSMNL